MSLHLSKKLTELLGKVDDKIAKKKIENALEMLEDEKYTELAQKLKSMDKEELLQKINELDVSKLSEQGIPIDEIKKKISEEDLSKMAGLIGEHGQEIIDKMKDLMKE